jgi:hypothetical protein
MGGIRATGVDRALADCKQRSGGRRMTARYDVDTAAAAPAFPDTQPPVRQPSARACPGQDVCS